MIRGLVLGLAIAALVGCGGGGSTPTPPIGDLTPGPCPIATGTDGADLTGLGATLAAFTAAHGPQDQQGPSRFSTTISGGINDGLPAFTARCSGAGFIVSVEQHLPTLADARTVIASLVRREIVPADATLVSDTAPMPCEVLIYRSALLASYRTEGDPQGTFAVKLIPATVPPSDLQHVGSVRYELTTTPGC